MKLQSIDNDDKQKFYNVDNRRILLSDIPSMAIEKVHILNNTSVIQVPKF